MMCFIIRSEAQKTIEKILIDEFGWPVSSTKVSNCTFQVVRLLKIDDEFVHSINSYKDLDVIKVGHQFIADLETGNASSGTIYGLLSRGAFVHRADQFEYLRDNWLHLP